MTHPDPSAPEMPPQTVWECCLIWADLLINLHLQGLEQSRQGQLTEEDAALFAGPDRPLVALLIAAALHERIRRLEMSFADAVFVPLAAPREEGVTGTLRRSPYSALEMSPDLSHQGRTLRALLMEKALASHPDDRLLWDRVRTAALAVVDDVAANTQARHTGPRRSAARADSSYWERGITIGDVLLEEQERRRLDQLAEFWGEEH